MHEGGAVQVAREMQERLLATHRMEFLGMGPAATGGTSGWAMRPDIFFRCPRCDYYMAADPDTYDDCYCGDLHKDAAAGRFGSRLGDDAIEVYRGHVTGVGG